MKFLRRFGFALILSVILPVSAFSADYGLPKDIQKGNILHCFNWKLSMVKSELPDIAAAGFGAVQVSPLQRNVSAGTIWYDVYRPYDFAFVASSGLGSRKDLIDLCAEAEKYGIKVIVDVVMNHVDGSAGNKNSYHDPWWNSNGRLRWLGDVNYGNRYSITHNQLGGGNGYPDVNSEDPEVAARAKAYIEDLKSMGVKGIRFDAAKHIALPSEGCDFWPVVTSVPDMYYYGEILNSPGGNNSNNLMKEYTNYLSVTDDSYGSSALSSNGAPRNAGNWTSKGVDGSKLVYWGESHDTYSNDPPYGGETKEVSQEQIDRAYAIQACRNLETALYLSRPSGKASASIKVGYKGSNAYTSTHIAAVNQFRNKMIGKKDAYIYTAASSAGVVTRENGGAVIVGKSPYATVSVTNAQGYCPPGTYRDRVSGNVFTVTSSTISGQLGSTGIAVLYDDNDNNGMDGDFGDGEKPTEFNLPLIKGAYLKNVSGWEQPHVWAWTSSANCTASGSWPGDRMTKVDGTYWKWEVPAGKVTPENIIFNIGSSDTQTSDLGYMENGVYDNSGNLLGIASGEQSGISGIEEGDTDAAPVYYNLQGVRVANPSGGIFIVVKGNKTTKEYFK